MVVDKRIKQLTNPIDPMSMTKGSFDVSSRKRISMERSKENLID
jgi:hypothetical protein